MPEIFDNDDDLDDLDQDEDAKAPPAVKPNQFQELRRKERQQAKELKELRAKFAEAEEFRTKFLVKEREAAASKVIEDLGLPKNIEKLWAMTNPDTEPTREAVQAWAVDYGLLTPVAKSEESQEFRPFSVAGSNPTRGGKLKYEEYQEMMASNPQEALQAVAEDRVEGFMSTPDND